MNIPKKIRDMLWPEEWKNKGLQDVIVTLQWPVIDHERILVATFRRNTEKNSWKTPGPDVRVVCSKKRCRAALQYRDGSKGKKRGNLDTAVNDMQISVYSCYPEISPEDEAALGKWLGCRESRNHMLPELAAWVENAMEREQEDAKRARKELDDDDVTRLCPDELPKGLVEFVRTVTIPSDRTLIYKKGNVRGTCFACRKKVYATGKRFIQGSVVKCPNCGAKVDSYLEGSDRYKANYVQDVITIQKGKDGSTLFLRQWHLCRDMSARWADIPAQLEEIARYGIRGDHAAKWQIEKKNWYMNCCRYRLKSWERVRNVTEVYDGTYQFFLPPEWKQILQGTSLVYCDLGGYIIERDLARREADYRGNPVRFLIDWARYPAVEKLWKAGYTGIIHDRVCGNWRCKKGKINWKAKTIQDATHLPLRLLRIREAKNWDAGTIAKMLDLYRMAQEKIIQEREAVELFGADVEIDNVRAAIGHATVHKIVKYIEKLIEEEVTKKDAEQAEAKRKNMPYYRDRITSPETYRDYLQDCTQLGLDLDDREVLFPADLETAHQRTIEQVRYQKNKKAAEKFEKQVKKIQSMTWEQDGLLIRPARTPGELTKEGKALHHCVGGYADRMAKGETAILLIRKVDAPDIPYYTLEYRNGQVIQCRTSHNATYTADAAVKGFVDAWVGHLNTRKKTTSAE